MRASTAIHNGVQAQERLMANHGRADQSHTAWFQSAVRYGSFSIATRGRGGEPLVFPSPNGKALASRQPLQDITTYNRAQAFHGVHLRSVIALGTY